MSKGTGLAFLYCTFKESRTPATYIRLVLKQLCQRMPLLPSSIRNIYQLHFEKDSQPTYTELAAVLSTVIQQFDSVFLILDALDECTLDQRTALCAFLLGIIKPKVTTEISQGPGEF